MTIKPAKPEFLVVARPPRVVNIPAKSGDKQEAARVFYVAATRATRKLVMELE